MISVFSLSLLTLSCVLSFEVSTTPYYYTLQDKYHESWILPDENFDGHVITCLKECRKNGDCKGLAVESLPQEYENFIRSCYMLSKLDLTDCDDGSCNNEGFQVFQLEKPANFT